MKPKRFHKQDWVVLGLETLKQEETTSLTIDRLCDLAGKTKGSFYAHFETMDTYLETLAREWYKRFTTDITAPPLPRSQRTDLLNRLAARLDLELEVGIRNLACICKPVREIVALADQERIKWLTALYHKSGQYSLEEAKALASIEIAAFTGLKLVNPKLSAQDAAKLYQDFLSLTGRS